ncbi:MAG: type II secretion system F family protein [Acinetobacter sp.]|nr:type II secretion system F family protein [Acinetobacter sp.]
MDIRHNKNATTRTAISVKTFRYQGINRKKKKVSGEILAKNLHSARSSLQKQGIQVKRLTLKRQTVWHRLWQTKIRRLDLTIFFRQFATMIKAGVPLLQSLMMIAESSSHTRLQQLIIQVRKDIEQGLSLANALKKHPQYFDYFTCALVATGEQSGTLEHALQRIAYNLEKQQFLQQKIRKALKYPILVILVAIAVCFILLLNVVPMFQDLFQSFGAELPILTQWVLQLSHQLQQSWWLILLGSLAFIVLCRVAYQRSIALQRHVQHLLLKLPIIGALLQKNMVARFSRTLATTFAAGLALIDSLNATAPTLSLHRYQSSVLQIRDAIATGQQLHFALKESQLFPAMVIQMVAIGEESGTLDRMLDKVATHYEHEVEQAVEGLTSLIEPLIIVLLGAIVGTLVLALYLPILDLGNAI